MNIQLDHCRILHSIPIEFSFEDFAEFLKQTKGGEKILDHARHVFDKTDGTWFAGAVFCPMHITEITGTKVVLEHPETASPIQLTLGWSGRFLQGAERVLIGAYTTGLQLGKAAKRASETSRYLDAFIIEQMDLALLGKTSEVINGMIESIAAQKNWGIGPLLSPGSVHGWDLADQRTLCTHLPLAEIGITCSSSSVLNPFNSLTFAIGIGPHYTNHHVGSPCTVCANRDKCELRQQAP